MEVRYARTSSPIGATHKTQTLTRQPLCLPPTALPKKKGQAGWGYVARRTTRGNAQADTDAKYSHADALTRETGRVVTNPSQPEYLGATKATNNTGELSAVHHALSRAAGLATSGEEILIMSDSQLAICTTTGAWAPRTNRALIGRNRAALAKMKKNGLTVRFQHVRAHNGHKMNEEADELANQGAQSPTRPSSTVNVRLSVGLLCLSSSP